MKNIVLCACLALGIFAGPVFADEEGPWSGKIGLGYLAASGNVDNEALNAEAGVNWDGERWHHGLSGKAIGRTESKKTTAESYKAAYDAKFDMTERTYLFGLIDYNKDRFSSYTQQIFEVAGVGHRLIMTEKHKLNIELGGGLTQNDLADGSSQDEGTARASGDYTWQISENASFMQKLAVNWSSSNTYTESVSELRAGIIGNVGLALSYTIKNNSSVVPGTKKTDTWTAINIDYKF